MRVQSHEDGNVALCKTCYSITDFLELIYKEQCISTYGYSMESKTMSHVNDETEEEQLEDVRCGICKCLDLIYYRVNKTYCII